MSDNMQHVGGVDGMGGGGGGGGGSGFIPAPSKRQPHPGPLRGTVSASVEDFELQLKQLDLMITLARETSNRIVPAVKLAEVRDAVPGKSPAGLIEVIRDKRAKLAKGLDELQILLESINQSLFLE